MTESLPQLLHNLAIVRSTGELHPMVLRHEHLLPPRSLVWFAALLDSIQVGDAWAHRVVLDGKLYLRSQDTLMCYDLRAKP
jgi:hypothetical protein